MFQIIKKYKTIIFPLSLLVILYFIRGTSYFYTKIAVNPGTGFSALFMAGVRHTLAGLIILILLCVFRKMKVLPFKIHAFLFLNGILIWSFGNGFVTLAVRTIPSSIVAIVMGLIPLFILIIESLFTKKNIGLKNITAIIVGLAGLILIITSGMHKSAAQSGVSFGVGSVFLLIIAPLSFSYGTVIQKIYSPRNNLKGMSDLFISSGFQLLYGGVTLLLGSLIFDEKMDHFPSTAAILSLTYLTIIGSAIGFSVYVLAIKKLSLLKISSIPYVAPVVATIFGVTFLDEKINAAIILGGLLIFLSLAGLTIELNLIKDKVNKIKGFVQKTISWES